MHGLDRQEQWELARECVRALAGGESNSTEVREALWLKEAADELLSQVARETAARESWAYVGEQAGISRQAAWERWHVAQSGPLPTPPIPGDWTDDDDPAASVLRALRTTPQE